MGERQSSPFAASGGNTPSGSCRAVEIEREGHPGDEGTVMRPVAARNPHGRRVMPRYGRVPTDLRARRGQRARREVGSSVVEGSLTARIRLVVGAVPKQAIEPETCSSSRPGQSTNGAGGDTGICSVSAIGPDLRGAAGYK